LRRGKKFNQKMKNKRGVSLSLNTMIVIILALLVLVIVAISFTGGMKGFVGKMQEFLQVSSATTEDFAINQCETWCSIGAEQAFCSKIMKVEKVNGDVEEVDCEGLGVSCEEIKC